MNYKSIHDLTWDALKSLHKIPQDALLIVGVPRSGLMVASIVSLLLNIRFCDLDTFLQNRPLRTGQTRQARGSIDHPFDAPSVVIMDDSIFSGGSLEVVRQLVSASGYEGRVSYAAAYATEDAKEKVDLYFELLSMPRFFQWNIFHRKDLMNFCLDIDGIVCLDPTPEQNDDGERYRDFLLNAPILNRPSCKVGHLVTSRLEKYRGETVAWLNRHGIEYEKLHMLDLPSAAERQRLGAHGSFKAQVYNSLPETTLFIESESSQARYIYLQTGKNVLDFQSQRLVTPATGSDAFQAKYANLRTKVNRTIRRVLAI